jgi:hypothetical protein
MAKKHQIVVSSKRGRSRSGRKWRRQAKQSLNQLVPFSGLEKKGSEGRTAIVINEVRTKPFKYDNRMRELLDRYIGSLVNEGDI